MTLEQFIADANKAFGSGSAMIIGATQPVKIDVIPTGIKSIDKAIRVLV